MTCEQVAWSTAAQKYQADMVALEQACLAEEQAVADVTAAEAALVTAQEALIAAQQAHEASRSQAAISQLATVNEAQKLGVDCECPGGSSTPAVLGKR